MDEINLDELFQARKVGLCPYQRFAQCEWVGTYRCTSECEFHPENYHLKEEVIAQFREEPWSVYCLTCGKFLDTRFGHPEEHRIATGMAEYREKLPQHIMDILKGREDEGTEMPF